MYDKVLCLAKDCKELIQPYLPLCKLCFLQSMAGKIEILVLRDNLGNAVFSPTTTKLDFPSTVPKTRYPKTDMKKGKALMSFVTNATDSPSPVFVPFCAFHDFHVTAAPEERMIGEACTDAGEYPDPPVVELPGYPLTGQVAGSFTTSDITTGPDSPLLEANVPALATAPSLQDSGAIGTYGSYGPQRDLSEAIYVDSSYGDLAYGLLATPPSFFSHDPTNQGVSNGKDLSFSNPNGIPVLFTSFENASSANHDPLTFYVDSGAGQCLCSNDSSFIDMTPCMVEITGIAGALQIYGCGTALFLDREESGHAFVLRVHNCLFGRGQFNLLSVSQLNQKAENSVNLCLDSSTLTLRTSGTKKRSIRFPLFVDDGLFGIKVEPLSSDDSRFFSLSKVDVTPGGEFQLSDDRMHRWSSKILAS